MEKCAKSDNKMNDIYKLRTKRRLGILWCMDVETAYYGKHQFITVWSKETYAFHMNQRLIENSRTWVYWL